MAHESAHSGNDVTVDELYAESQPRSARVGSTLLDLAIAAGAGSAAKQATPESEDLQAWVHAEATADLAIAYVYWRLGGLPESVDQTLDILNRDIAEIDAILSAQVNAILHHPSFQQLEAGWRGIRLLVDSTKGAEEVKIGMLNVTRAELEEDLNSATEFDQSEVFRKVYEEEYGMPGGEPFGALIGNYEFRRNFQDISLLRQISGVAAAAFAPFIAGTDPSMFGVDEFPQLERIAGELSELFPTDQFNPWTKLRTSEDSRFVALTMPRVLMRAPHDLNPLRGDGFVFVEEAGVAPDAGEKPVPSHQRNRSYLWGNAAFALGCVLIRAFVKTGWLADIRGTMYGPGTGGAVEELPVLSFATDSRGVALRSSVDTNVGELREKELSELGFIPLCDCPRSGISAFYATQTINKPLEYTELEATTNARLSSMLQYVLCSSRFAHYLKVLARESIGGPADPAEMQARLHSWLQQWVSADPGASPEHRAKYPLRAAQVEVHAMPGEPGHYRLTLQLSPHYQLDDMSATVRLVSELRS